MAEIIFRLDDVQDGWLVKTQLALFDFFANNELGPQALVLGVIGNSIHDNSYFLQELRSYLTHNKRFELACHGFSHEDFSLMTEAEQDRQFSLFAEFSQKLLPEFELQTFIPPFNRFNIDTITTAVKYGYNILSALEGGHSRSNFFNNPSFMNSTVSAIVSYAETPIMYSSDEIIKSIQSQLNSKFDWCVVMLHPQEFSNNLDDRVNAASLETLQKVIRWSKENGHKLTTFSEMRSKLKNVDYVTEYLSSFY